MAYAGVNFGDSRLLCGGVSVSVRNNCQICIFLVGWLVYHSFFFSLSRSDTRKINSQSDYLNVC